MSIIFDEFNDARILLEEFISKKDTIDQIEKAGSLMLQALSDQKKIIACGNGGSMSDAMHFAEELLGRYRNNRPSLPAIAISDPAYISCAANDFGYDFIFSRFVEGMGNKGDILLAISTSGNSPNVINAAIEAKRKGMHVIALTGKDGGSLAKHADVEVRIEYFGYADRIQEIHIKIIHSLIHFIEHNLGFTTK